jgi:hypothetical protein
MNRPRVDLSKIDAVLRRVLEHPVAAVVEELLPETMGAVREAASDLPALASGLEARAVAEVSRASRELEGEIVDGMTQWVRETIRAGRGQAKPKALRAPRRIAARKASAKGKNR